MTRHLSAAGLAVHWNGTTEEWDMRVRRGSTASATLRVVVEQHDGPSWRARFRMGVRRPLAWPVLATTAVAYGAAWAGAPLLAGCLVLAPGAGWALTHLAAARLEDTVRSAAAEALRDSPGSGA